MLPILPFPFEPENMLIVVKMGIFPQLCGDHPLKEIFAMTSIDLFFGILILLLMAEILHHLGCMKPYK